MPLAVRFLFNRPELRRFFSEEGAAFAPPKLHGNAQRLAWATSQQEPVTRWAYERMAALSRARGAVR